jgi:hypothetical protein
MKRPKLDYFFLALAVVVVAIMTACRNHEPRLSVFSPPPSAHFVQGDTVHFASELNSESDPGVIKSDAWRWVSNVDGEIGRGPRVDVTSLSVGKHMVTASVTHALGVSQESVTVFVEPRQVTR